MRLLLSFLTVIIAFSALFAGEIPAAIEGFWLSQNQDAVIEILPRDGFFYGKIVWLEEPLDESGNPKTDTENPEAGLRERQIIGLEILKEFRQKKNKWKGGTIYDPETGKTYSCSMKLKEDRLHIRGFIGISLLGRTEIWTRIETLPEP